MHFAVRREPRVVRASSAPNYVTMSQNALSTTAEEILAARPQRRRAVVQNLEATDGIVIYVGADNTVSSTTGFALAGQQSVEITSKAAVWAEAASGTPSIGILEEYD